MITRGDHASVTFHNDNKEVWNVIRHLTHGGAAWSWVSQYARTCNGRDAYKAIKAHYLGPSYRSRIQAACDALLNKTYFDGNRNFTLESYTTTLQKAFTDLEICEEPVSEQRKVRILLAGITTPALLPAKGIISATPELNDNFRYLVSTARQLKPNVEIIDRCNLTVLQEPGQEDLVDFLKRNRVRIVASLPCYSAANVDQQRGNGVFERSISALLALNDAGYGVDPELPLDLVYNPSGAFLPPPQESLQDQYKVQLKENFGILFDSLFTITNMPIKRFADFLHRRGELQDYMQLLARNFNVDTVDSLMCRDTVSVGYDGKLYDCDFNQQLGLGIVAPSSLVNKDGKEATKIRARATREITVFDVENLESALSPYAIRTDNHCFGCTAGMGSSCQGTTAS